MTGIYIPKQIPLIGGLNSEEPAALWSWNPDFAPSALEFSEGNTRVTNVGDSVLDHTVPSKWLMDGPSAGHDIRQWVYYEFQFNNSHSGTPVVYSDAFLGWSGRSAYSFDAADYNGEPRSLNSFWALTVRGDGLWRGGSGTIINNAGVGFGDYDPPMVFKVLHHPEDDDFFFAGQDGLWRGTGGTPVPETTGDPIVDGTPYYRIQNDAFFMVYLPQPGMTCKIAANASDQIYRVPASAVALGTINPVDFAGNEVTE